MRAPGRWLLLVLLLLGGLVVAVIALRGIGLTGAGDDDEPSGLWRRSDRGSQARARVEEQRRRIAELEAIGYVDGSELPTTEQVVTIHDRERAWPGLNFYTSGHGGEAILLDMEGRVLHRWHSDFRALWPNREYPPRKDYWRRAVLLPDGHVIAIYAGRGILKLDRHSNVVWKSAVQAHHDLDVQPNGDIYLLTRRAHTIPRIHPSEPVMEDFVLVLGPDGRKKRRVSVLEAVERSEFMSFWPSEEAARVGDVFHTNSIEVLDGRFAERAPWLRAGNVLTSMRRLHTLAVIDLDRERVVQMWRGDFRAQHDPRILENGNLLLFDNRGMEDASRVIEYGLLSRRPVWTYSGTEDAPFYSQFCGAADRLPNGNTLISESGHGRAFEVTPTGEIVWEFHNPARAGPNGEYVASLLELVRFPSDYTRSWLEVTP